MVNFIPTKQTLTLLFWQMTIFIIFQAFMSIILLGEHRGIVLLPFAALLGYNAYKAIQAVED